MLVATFGPGTAWVGREIIWDVDRFILVGHGAIPAAGVLDYDRLGQLVWARPELRNWVAEVHRWETGVWPRAAAGGATWAGVQPAGAAGGAAASTRRLPTWALVLIIVGVALFVIGPIIVAVAIPVVTQIGETAVNDALVRDGVTTICSGIEDYANGHGGQYPPEVSATALSRYVLNWPDNPYTGAPMVNSASQGDFLYTVDGVGGYTLIGYGRDGAVVIDLSNGADPTY